MTAVGRSLVLSPPPQLLCDVDGDGTYRSVVFSDLITGYDGRQEAIVLVPDRGGTKLAIERDDDGDRSTMPKLVVDTKPIAKHINISSQVLCPVGQGEGSTPKYIIGRIVEKAYRPVRVTVALSDGRVDHFNRDEIRPLIAPWSSWVHELEAGMSSQADDKRKRSARRYRKGEISRTATGELRKYNGKQWRRICADAGCLKEVQKMGYCSRHMEERRGQKKSRSEDRAEQKHHEAAFTLFQFSHQAWSESSAATVYDYQSLTNLIPTAPPSTTSLDRESPETSDMEFGGGGALAGAALGTMPSHRHLFGTPPWTPTMILPPSYFAPLSTDDWWRV